MVDSIDLLSAGTVNGADSSIEKGLWMSNNILIDSVERSCPQT